MKKFLVVLLSLGLIAAFSMTALAASGNDVKFSGQYYVVGMYENNRTLADSDVKYSRAVYWSRLRVQTEFKIVEGLSLTTRFDAFEKQWGAVNRSSGTSEDKGNSGKVNSVNVTLQENIEMEYGYVTFKTAAGVFDVGYQAADEWGTGFANTPGTRPRIKFTTKFGPVTLLGILEKVYEADTIAYGSAAPSKYVDADMDNYMLAGIFSFKGGDAGLLLKYANAALTRPTLGYRSKAYIAAPYFRGTFGPVFVEGELVYITGKAKEYDAGTPADQDYDGLGYYLKAQLNLGPFWVGGQIGFSSGDVDATDSKDNNGPKSTTQWVPTLFFAESNMRSYVYSSHSGGANGVTYSCDKQNLMLYQIFGGFKPTPKLKFDVAVTMMKADKAPAGYDSKDYGTEADIMATYSIYDNLTYMVGAGYMWTGDFFKGTNVNNKVGNDYVVLNKLTLNF